MVAHVFGRSGLQQQQLAKDLEEQRRRQDSRERQLDERQAWRRAFHLEPETWHPELGAQNPEP
jgi:hypothetical protein